MSCVFDKERLTAFFDGELDAEERAETERHISGCSECLRDLGEIKSAASAVKTLARPRAPRSIAEGVAREIAVAGRVRRIDLWRRRAVWAVGAAAILLVTLNVMFFTRAPEPDALAKAAPVTGIGAQLPSDADDKSLQRDAAKASSEEKDAVDKLGADNRARRAAEGGR
ncbi:MAG TPA: zf-HC2 domain-containing protein, partial [Planctomycetota bacterium]